MCNKKRYSLSGAVFAVQNHDKTFKTTGTDLVKLIQKVNRVGKDKRLEIGRVLIRVF